MIDWKTDLAFWRARFEFWYAVERRALPFLDWLDTMIWRVTHHD